MKKHTILLGLLVSTLLLQGCAALVVGGAAGTAKASGDRRTLGAQWDDQTIELKAANLLADNKPLSAASKISVYSNNGRVLLVGQTPSDVYKIEAGKIVSRIEGVRHVYNELRIGQPVSFTTRSNDSWITSKVKADMFGTKNFDSTKVKVVTENGEVFLIGLVTRQEGEQAVNIARHVTGVKRVIKAFEFAQN
ncbi:MULTISPECIES: division/outer membrane stress-associated lipid-binding lipoprotein [Aeromonas]|uniref:division/outer membrane stress-associated lipid-binding lipoprotein n=1 Tax=Aeromonas TaxID=642 RepID=UPI0005AB7283|nr:MULTISPECIES: division/outer membrane stress-associated lipid-binding lipoprotein [Aeromonas]OKP40952.1 osmotically-inducible protein OsmY [Aeromonas veronii]QXB00793.1 divisome-associated lipoprotein YraP [Aeromonas sp. FDAARGOS 1416]